MGTILEKLFLSVLRENVHELRSYISNSGFNQDLEIWIPGVALMKFRSLIVKNIFRNKGRSLLVIMGIAIATAAILGLGLVTDGLAASTQQALTAGAADFSVIPASFGQGPEGGQGNLGGGSANQSSSSSGFETEAEINQSTVNSISQMSGVGQVAGVLRSRIELNGTQRPLTLLGIDGNLLSMENVQITNGTVFTNSNEVIIGQTAATGLNKTIGDELTISNQTFKIVGIYQTGDFMNDRGIITSLSTLQNLTNTTGVSMVLVKASNGTSADSLAQKIENTYPNQLTTTKSLSGFNRMNQGIQTIESGSWAVSLLALLIGGVIVVLTMLKSVSERTREIGVLKAVGWDRRRILGLILGESLILAVIATIIGLLIGVGAVEALSSTRLLMFIHPAFSVDLLLRAVGVALFLGIIGGIYPAYRASRLAPTEALRYE